MYMGSVDIFKGSCKSLTRFNFYNVCLHQFCEFWLIIKVTFATLIKGDRWTGKPPFSHTYLSSYGPKVTQLCISF